MGTSCTVIQLFFTLRRFFLLRNPIETIGLLIFKSCLFFFIFFSLGPTTFRVVNFVQKLRYAISRASQR